MVIESEIFVTDLSHTQLLSLFKERFKAFLSLDPDIEEIDSEEAFERLQEVEEEILRRMEAPSEDIPYDPF